MPTNNNTSISKRIRDLFRIQQAVEEVPNQVASSILPIVDVSPEKEMFSEGTDRQASGAGTLLTTHESKKTYLTSAYLGQTKDVDQNCGNGRTALSTSINGSSSLLLQIPALTLTAQDNIISTQFDPPILLDKNTAIVTAGSGTTFGAGTSTIVFGVTGYEEEI